ncbi:hypothetical protein BKA24_001673 [Microbacterium marinum]|uniref:Uncharacterized protein n=1 Tax=Microbacterium marinum TaxID=421115 RepID=A0A7W7BSP1_9MICO|nr:hypothetical protein [Microbacterium marinum]MBB4666964.1 hypothetical protein [Microbacterium marinum]
MGTSKRYAAGVDRQMNERILQRTAAAGPLQSLTSTELRLDEVPLTIDPQPRRKVRAWVRFGDTPVRVNAVAARWTPDAIGLEFTVDGAAHRCWVWVGAVDEIDTQTAGR